MEKIKLRYKTFKNIENSPGRRIYMVAHKHFFSGNVDFDTYEGCKFLCAFHGDKVVGIIAYLQEKKTTELWHVYVLTKYRKKGVLRGMLGHLLRFNKRLSWESVPDAMKAYEKVGGQHRGYRFKLDKEHYIKNNE